jgi:N-acetylneuraminic acid mutarotase
VKQFRVFIFVASVAHGQVWLRQADFPGERRDDGVAIAAGSKAYFGTGLQDWWIASRDFYAFDPATHQWSKISDMPSGKDRQYACAFATQNAFYVFGGDANGSLNDLFRYDVASSSWTEMTPKPGSGLAGAVAVSMSGFAIIYGGRTTNGTVSNEVWQYDFTADSWTKLSDCPFGGRWRATGTVMSAAGNSALIMFGLDNNGAYRKELFRYERTGDKWTLLEEFPHGPGRAYATMREINGKFLLFGGQDTTAKFYNETWQYASGTWSLVSTLPASGRRGDMSCVVNNKLCYSCGLGTGDTRLKETWMFDPAGDPISGLSDNTNADKVEIHPNPAVDFIRISGVNGNLADVEVSDLTGKTLFRSDEMQVTGQLNVAELNAGIYFLRVFTQTNVFQLKFIKE